MGNMTTYEQRKSLFAAIEQNLPAMKPTFKQLGELMQYLSIDKNKKIVNAILFGAIHPEANADTLIELFKPLSPQQIMTFLPLIESKMTHYLTQNPGLTHGKALNHFLKQKVTGDASATLLRIFKNIDLSEPMKYIDNLAESEGMSSESLSPVSEPSSPDNTIVPLLPREQESTPKETQVKEKASITIEAELQEAQIDTAVEATVESNYEKDIGASSENVQTITLQYQSNVSARWSVLTSELSTQKRLNDKPTTSIPPQSITSSPSASMFSGLAVNINALKSRWRAGSFWTNIRARWRSDGTMFADTKNTYALYKNQGVKAAPPFTRGTI